MHATCACPCRGVTPDEKGVHAWLRASSLGKRPPRAADICNRYSVARGHQMSTLRAKLSFLPPI